MHDECWDVQVLACMWRSEVNLVELLVSFCLPVGCRMEQVAGLTQQVLYLLSQLTVPLEEFFKYNLGIQIYMLSTVVI